MKTPLDSAIDNVVKCVKCGKGMKECNCWIKCKCGWFYAIGKKCRNPIHKSKIIK